MKPICQGQKHGCETTDAGERLCLRSDGSKWETFPLFGASGHPGDNEQKQTRRKWKLNLSHFTYAKRLQSIGLSACYKIHLAWGSAEHTPIMEKQTVSSHQFHNDGIQKSRSYLMTSYTKRGKCLPQSRGEGG